MSELKQIKNALNPDETLLVVDAMTGQEAATLTARYATLKLLSSTFFLFFFHRIVCTCMSYFVVLNIFFAVSSYRFNEDIGITGAILTKMDGDTRGVLNCHAMHLLFHPPLSVLSVFFISSICLLYLYLTIYQSFYLSFYLSIYLHLSFRPNYFLTKFF